MADKATPRQMGGCVNAILALFVTVPLWLVLLYSILSRLEVGTFEWVLFAVYCTASVCNCIVGIMVNIMTE